MKKLINAADAVVTDSLAGMAAAHPNALRVDIDRRIVYRAHVVTGELRAEENGSSDSACWVPIAELDTLRYGTLIDEVASMMGFQNAAAWSREYQEFLADENARKI